jgi:hypothetical protein|uniref:Uncharacterized protein n=1 Tax=viral metagenome TaxID=1070528 RepID=A0A6C0IL31_9ZZZZ
MSNNIEQFSSSLVEINKHNELVINNRMKKLYKSNGTNNEIDDVTDSLKMEKTIKHFFLSSKINGSTINILFG